MFLQYYYMFNSFLIDILSIICVIMYSNINYSSILIDILSIDGIASSFEVILTYLYNIRFDNTLCRRKYYYYIILIGLYYSINIITWFRFSYYLYIIFILMSPRIILKILVNINLVNPYIEYVNHRISNLLSTLFFKSIAYNINRFCVDLLGKNPYISHTEIRDYVRKIHFSGTQILQLLQAIFNLWIYSQFPNFVIRFIYPSTRICCDDVIIAINKRQWDLLLTPPYCSYISYLYINKMMVTSSLSRLLKFSLILPLSIYSVSAFFESWKITLLLLIIVTIFPWYISSTKFRFNINQGSFIVLKILVCTILSYYHKYLYIAVIFKLMDIINIPPIRQFITHSIISLLLTLYRIIHVTKYNLYIIVYCLFNIIITPQLHLCNPLISISLSTISTCLYHSHLFIILLFSGIFSNYNPYHMVVMSIMIYLIQNYYHMPSYNISKYTIIDNYPDTLNRI